MVLYRGIWCCIGGIWCCIGVYALRENENIRRCSILEYVIMTP